MAEDEGVTLDADREARSRRSFHPIAHEGSSRHAPRGRGAAILPAQRAAVRAIAADLKEARMRQGLSLADMARRSGLTRPAISRLENGLRPNPTLDTLFRYAAALGLEIRLAVWSAGDVPAASTVR